MRWRLTVLLLALAAIAVAPSTGRCEAAAAAPVAAADTKAILELAERLSAGRGVTADPVAAAALYQRIAEAGNAMAQRLLANCYFAGIGVERNPQLAAEWLEKSAAQNFALSQGELAYLYLTGSGVPRDFARALDLARKSAEQGSPGGEDVLGLIFAYGSGIKADPDEALRWLTKAAEGGTALAMLHLGQLYRDGTALPLDPVLARVWLDLAASHAQSAFEKMQAVKARDDLSAELLPDDLARAERLAREWKAGADLPARRIALATEPVPDISPASLPTDIVVTPLPALDAPPPPEPSDPPAAMRQWTVSYAVESDGSYTRTDHTELQVLNESAASNMGERTLAYREALDSVEVTEAYTLKPDGRRLPVDPAAIFTKLAPGAPSFPTIDDQRQKIVVFPDVAVGDVMVLTATYRSKALINGFFSASMVFDPNFRAQEVRIEIISPETLPLRTETHGLSFEERESEGKRHYSWHYSNPSPAPERPIVLNAMERWPRLFASSYRSYDELAAAYLKLAAPAMVVTPAIQKLADEITAETTDKRRQAELIYYWVSRRIRFVGIELGRGAIIPHDVSTVLANGYGDCKDHAALFSALLEAKGIASEVVLINNANSYALPSAPGFAALNHAITWLPDFGIYADTTVGVAPFGTLPFAEYGKPVVHATAAGSAVRRTPVVPPDAATLAERTTARLAADGRITGESETVATGPWSLTLRQEAMRIQSSGAEHAAKYILRSKNLDGTGRFDFGSPFEPSEDYKVTGRFDVKANPEIVQGGAFFLPVGLMLGASPGEFLMGLIAFTDPRGDEPTPCYSGHQAAQWSLELPPGKRVRGLPKDVQIRNRYLTYHSHWWVTGQTVSVRREFSAAIDRPVCIGETRTVAARALNDIRRDYSAEIALVDK